MRAQRSPQPSLDLVPLFNPPMGIEKRGAMQEKLVEFFRVEREITIPIRIPKLLVWMRHALEFSSTQDAVSIGVQDRQ